MLGVVKMIDITNDKQVIDQLEFLKNRLHEDDSIAALDCVINRMKDEQWKYTNEGNYPEPHLFVLGLVQHEDLSNPRIEKVYVSVRKNEKGFKLHEWHGNNFDEMHEEVVAWQPLPKKP